MAAQGRRRVTKISLASCAGTYQATSDGKLITKPEDGKPTSPWRVPVGSTLIDEFRYYFGSEPEAEAHARRYIRESTARMRIDGDPLGLLTRAYQSRPKVFPTAPTPERLLQGKKSGEVLDRRPVMSDKGEPLSEYITEIVPALRNLRRLGTLDHDEYEAAVQLCKDYYGARFPGPAASKYQERVDGGGKGQIENDHMIACRQKFHRAWDYVHPYFEYALAWVLSTLGDPPPLEKVGAFYAPARAPSMQTTIGGANVKAALAILCSHYRINHRVQSISGGARVVLALLPD